MTITKCDWCELEDLKLSRVEIIGCKVVSSYIYGTNLTAELCYHCQRAVEDYSSGTRNFDDMREYARAQVIKEKLIHDSDKDVNQTCEGSTIYGPISPLHAMPTHN